MYRYSAIIVFLFSVSFAGGFSDSARFVIIRQETVNLNNLLLNWRVL